MAKRIKWSTQAVADRIQILDYWFHRIGNKTYCKKFDGSLREIIKTLADYPKLGRQFEEDTEERFFVLDCYQIFYVETEDAIELLHIWDSRRNPDDLNFD